MEISQIILNILNIELLGSEIWRYLAFVLSLVLYFPISKITKYLLSNILTQWAEKTKIKFDDILIKSLNPPASMFVFALLFYIGSKFITNEGVQIIFAKTLNFLLIIPIVYFLIKFTTELARQYITKGLGNKKISESAVNILIRIMRIMLISIGALLILANLGYNISALLAGLGIVGLAFSLAAQDIIKNFFAGLSLIFDKTFVKGERIKFNDNTGFIEELKLRTTKIRTYDGVLLTVPNSTLADNIVENITKVPRIKVKQTIGVTYDTSSKKLKQAKEIILKAITDEKHADEKRTWIYFSNFGAYSLDISIIYYSKDLNEDDWPQKVEFRERINFVIKEGFEKAGIEMAFPTQTIELKK